MLFVLPLILVAMVLLDHYFSFSPHPTVTVKGVIDIPYIGHWDKSWCPIVGFVAILGLAYLIFSLGERFKLFGQTTTLPALIYVLLTAGILVNIGFDNLLLAVFLVTIALWKLHTAINDTKSNAALYAFGFFIVLSVAIYPKFVLLLAWALGSALFLGRSTIKDIVALCLGMCTPLLFVVFYYFWTDRLETLPVVFTENLLAGNNLHHLPFIEWIRLGMLTVVLFFALTHLSTRYSLMVVNQRRGIFALISMVIFITLTILLVPGNYYDFMYLLALPLSLLYAQYFISSRWVICCNLVFLLLLAACFLTYWV